MGTTVAANAVVAAAFPAAEPAAEPAAAVPPSVPQLPVAASVAVATESPAAEPAATAPLPSAWDCEFCKFTSGSFDAVVDHEKSCSSNPEVVAAAKGPPRQESGPLRQTSDV